MDRGRGRMRSARLVVDVSSQRRDEEARDEDLHRVVENERE